MPERMQIYSCKFCGAEFEGIRGENEALNCEGMHLHIEDMELDIILAPGNDQFCYDMQSRWPTFIRIRSKSRAIEPAVYQLHRRGTRR